MNAIVNEAIPSYRNVMGYRSISIGFLYPTVQNLKRFNEAAMETLELEKSSLASSFWSGLNECVPLVPELGTEGPGGPLSLIQQEHFRLFGPSPSVYLDLAFYFSDNPFEQSKKMADMAGFLLAFGVDIKSESRVDHLPACFEFLSYLHLKLLNAQEKGLAEQAGITQRAMDSYTNDFLIHGVGSFYEKLLGNSQNRFYNILGKIALESVMGGRVWNV